MSDQDQLGGTGAAVLSAVSAIGLGMMCAAEGAMPNEDDFALVLRAYNRDFPATPLVSRELGITVAPRP